MKKVSIAMATYNGAAYIAEQLESFASQTVLPAELIVTDDGSTDNTLEIVAQFAARSPFPVHAEKNEQRLGFKENFMKAASLCKSEFIAFSDQDDVWLPHKLELCLAAFDNDDVLLVYHNATIVDEKLTPSGEMDITIAPRAINPPLTIQPYITGYGFTILFKRILLRFNKFYPQSVDFLEPNELEGHDQWFFFLASCYGNIYYIKQPLALYRRHSSTVTAWRQKFSSLDQLRSTDITSFYNRERFADKRASILECMLINLQEPDHSRAAKAASGYHAIAMHFRLRQQMYVTPGLIPRLIQCVKILSMGGYKAKNKWGVGYKALARDIVHGILFPLVEKP